MKRYRTNILSIFFILCFLFLCLMDSYFYPLFSKILDIPLMAILFIYLITRIAKNKKYY
jgi:hypothetical protein